MLPPDIPDVRTIEKMHFMNLVAPPSSILVHSNLQQHMKNSPQVISSSPPSLIAINAHSSVVLPESASTINNTTTNIIQTVHSNNSFNNNSNNNANYVNCDNSSDRTVVSETVVVADRVVDNHHLQQQQPQQPPQQQDENDEDRPPPVVILSGIGNKEVPGLVFGFDINEQLLNEDICENFISRYVEPENFKNSTHNHDKIVNFIGSGEYHLFLSYDDNNNIFFY